MYDSPINVIYGKLQTKAQEDMENHIFESVQSVGVMVDKDELIKALEYDRQQYEKGYQDGKNDFAAYMYVRICEIEKMTGMEYGALKSICDEARYKAGGKG